MIKLLRIDDRLLHGQVAQSWTSHYHIDQIFVINDDVMNDEFSKVTLRLAKPKNVDLQFYEISGCATALKLASQNEKSVMVIVERFKDAWILHQRLPQLKEMNVGGQRNKAETDAVQFTSSVTLLRADLDICRALMDDGVRLEIRQIPAEKEVLITLEKARQEG